MAFPLLPSQPHSLLSVIRWSSRRSIFISKTIQAESTGDSSRHPFPVHGLCFALLNFSSSLVPFSQLPLSTLLPGQPIWPLKCDISHILSQTVIFFLFSIFISAPLNPDPQNPTSSTFVPSVKRQLRFLNASAQGRSCLPFLASCPSMSYNVITDQNCQSYIVKLLG